MNEDYFYRVTRETPTRLWINNPTPDDAARAIAAGAISCTTNPAYCARMIQAKSEALRVRKLIDEIVRQTPNDEMAADLIQQRLVKPIMEKFLPLYDSRPGLEGFVSIQGNPHADDDPDDIVNQALQFRTLERNFITKIPVTRAGFQALEVLIAEDIPIIATEVFAMAQVVEACELYRRVSEKSGRHPPFYVTHISGIFEEYLTKLVQRDGIAVGQEALRQAGCALARKQYWILQERTYPVTMLGGGARGTHHFTEMVGGSIHITINWSTAQELLEANPPVIPRMNAQIRQDVVEELCRKLSDFRKAWFEDGMPIEEFEDFGPLQYFRGMFVKGWDTLLHTIEERRQDTSSDHVAGHHRTRG
jgi:transaldolase